MSEEKDEKEKQYCKKCGTELSYLSRVAGRHVFDVGCYKCEYEKARQWENLRKKWKR